MDPRLLKERDAFKKRAAAQPTIEKKKFSRPVVDPAYREESSSFKKHKPGAARDGSFSNPMCRRFLMVAR